jgi:enamine deaminase RidA (YjgF/YER057c/UK114 family)
MAAFKTYSYPGFGEFAKEHLHYSQAIRVGDRIHCSGQGMQSACPLSPYLLPSPPVPHPRYLSPTLYILNRVVRIPLEQWSANTSTLGGWIAQNAEVDVDNVIVPGLSNEIDQAFSNVEFNLKHAGGKGFSQVYKVVTYSTDIKAQSEHIVSLSSESNFPNFQASRELGVMGPRKEMLTYVSRFAI